MLFNFNTHVKVLLWSIGGALRRRQDLVIAGIAIHLVVEEIARRLPSFTKSPVDHLFECAVVSERGALVCALVILGFRRIFLVRHVPTFVLRKLDILIITYLCI